jgi:hypothetical protein
LVLVLRQTVTALLCSVIVLQARRASPCIWVIVLGDPPLREAAVDSEMLKYWGLNEALDVR